MSVSIPVNRQLNEKLDWLTEGPSADDQVLRINWLIAQDPLFGEFMKMATSAEYKITGLPEEMPGTYKPETDMPAGIADTTARQEFRRIKNFLPGGTMQRVTPAQRENSWIQLMEGMHWKEAGIMVHIKDQTLLNVYPNLREVFVKSGIATSESLAPAPAKKATKKAKAPK